MKQLNAYFYKNSAGNEPVREWLRQLPSKDRKIIGNDIKTVQFGWPLGMPLVRNLGDDLWEIRSNLSSRRIARILICLHQSQIILLHGFIKKTQKTPAEELKLALRRKKEVIDYGKK